MNYNLGNISKLLEKLFKAGFDTEKTILMMSLEDLTKIPDITSLEITIILDLKSAIKTKKIIAFLSGNKNIEKKEEKKWKIIILT